MKKIYLLLISIVFYFVAFSQECVFYYPESNNATLEFTNFDKKHEPTGKSIHTVTQLQKLTVGTEAVINVKLYDKKDKLTNEADMDVSCKNGIYYVNMKKFISSETTQSLKNFEIKVETEYLEFPSSLNVGQTLKDGQVKLTVQDPGMSMLNTTISIFNRKVVALEKVTTSAGTFDCYKITSDMTVKSIMTISISSIEWMSAGVGTIKSGSYNKSGNLIGSSELTKITQ